MNRSFNGFSRWFATATITLLAGLSTLPAMAYHNPSPANTGLSSDFLVRGPSIDVGVSIPDVISGRVIIGGRDRDDYSPDPYYYPPAGYNCPPGGYNYPPAGYNYPPTGYNYPPAGYNYPPVVYSYPSDTYNYHNNRYESRHDRSYQNNRDTRQRYERTDNHRWNGNRDDNSRRNGGSYRPYARH